VLLSQASNEYLPYEFSCPVNFFLLNVRKNIRRNNISTQAPESITFLIKIHEERILLPVRLRHTINRPVPVIDDLRIKFFGQISSLGLQHVTHKNPKQFDIVKKFNASENTPGKPNVDFFIKKHRGLLIKITDIIHQDLAADFFFCFFLMMNGNLAQLGYFGYLINSNAVESFFKKQCSR